MVYARKIYSDLEGNWGNGESGIAVFHFRHGGFSHAVAKNVQSGTTEVSYPVSLCSIQWAYVSNVGTRR